MNKGFYIKIISGEDEFLCGGGGAPLLDCDGFYAPDYDVKLTSYAGCDGGYPTVRRYGERVLTLEIELTDAERRRLVPMLNPTSDCVLEVGAGDETRRISVIPYSTIKFTPRVYGNSSLYSELYSELYSSELSFIAPGVFFEGASISVSGENSQIELENTGDVKCGTVVTFTAVGGDAVTPSVTCGDEYVKCPVTLHDGDVLVLDTRVGKKSITVNGKRYTAFDTGSTFFTLSRGKNVLTIDAESGGEYLSFSAAATPLYLGI